jgi:methylthioribose-1-phosphate isomerase
MRTVMWEAEGPAVRMIDQRLLPGKVVMIDLRTVKEVSEAIRDMAVRGAPAIGATAAFGLALAGATSLAVDSNSLWMDLDSASETLIASRPTASNLNWALEATS